MRIVNRVPDLLAKKFGGKEKINLTSVQRETGLSYPTVSSWAKDHINRVDFQVLATWCDYLQCQPGDLLTYEHNGEEGK